ncbi:MAG: AraC family transcriptional regulator [Lentisphaeria bacterium]|nr:MAG: AraC family transcriptional regulator [Lentisphaeria bacterium]
MQEDFIFPPPPDPRSPFRLHLAGTSYCDGNYRIELRECDLYFVFEFVESGRGQLQIDGVEYFPKKGDLYWIPNSGQRSYWSSAEDPWVKHWFNVSGPLVAELLRLYSLENVHLVRNFSRPELFTEGLQKLRRHPEQAHLPLGPEIISSIIAQIADDVLTRQDVNHPISDEGRQLREFLEKHIFLPMPSLAEMARLLHRSEIQTTRIFRRDFGEPPYQYLLKRKLAAAQELLHCTRRTIKQISADLHFSNEYYFAGLFKRKVGHSPAGTGAWSRPAK